VAASVRTALKRARVRGVFFGMLTFATFAGITVVLWQGGLLVLEGQLTAGSLVSFLLYTITIAASIGALASSFSAYQEAVGAAERVFEILEMDPAIADPPAPVTLVTPVAGRVAFEGVFFRYHDDGSQAWTLEGIDLGVAPGEIVALVGPSGGGKTTLVSLLPRFWDVNRGHVRLDGHDVRSLRLADLRGAIGVVPQEPALFSGTIGENIAYARPGASDAEIEEAARAAHAAGKAAAVTPDEAQAVFSMEDRVYRIQHPGLIEDDPVLKEVLLPEDQPGIVEKMEELDRIGNAAGFAAKGLKGSRAEGAMALVGRIAAPVLVAHRLQLAHHRKPDLADEGRVEALGCVLQMVIQSTPPLIGRSAISDRAAERPLNPIVGKGGVIAAIPVAIELVLDDDQRRCRIAEAADAVQPPGDRLIAKGHAAMLMGLGIVGLGRPHQHEHGAGLQKEHMRAEIDVLAAEIPDVEPVLLRARNRRPDEGNAVGGSRVLLERLAPKAIHNLGLADPTIAEDDQLDVGQPLGRVPEIVEMARIAGRQFS
jgi:ABC-type nitrate/sulfonate/bicarbonate transport system ATPase subunit